MAGQRTFLMVESKHSTETLAKNKFRVNSVEVTTRWASERSRGSAAKRSVRCFHSRPDFVSELVLAANKTVDLHLEKQVC